MTKDEIIDIRNALVSIAKSQERISQMITRYVRYREEKDTEWEKRIKINHLKKVKRK